jgi:hypothetical protein
VVAHATQKTLSIGWPRDASVFHKVVAAALVIPIALLVLALAAILFAVMTVAFVLVFALIAVAVLLLRGGGRHGSPSR